MKLHPHISIGQAYGTFAVLILLSSSYVYAEFTEATGVVSMTLVMAENRTRKGYYCLASKVAS